MQPEIKEDVIHARKHVLQYLVMNDSAFVCKVLPLLRFVLQRYHETEEVDRIDHRIVGRNMQCKHVGTTA